MRWEKVIFYQYHQKFLDIIHRKNDKTTLSVNQIILNYFNLKRDKRTDGWSVLLLVEVELSLKKYKGYV